MEGVRALGTDEECPLCGAQAYVLYDHDKMCANCAHTPSPTGSRGLVTTQDKQWDEWFAHRRESEDYSGWTGEDRIKFPGGFVSAYDF